MARNVILAVCLALALAPAASAATKSYPAGSLIVPMDTDYQDFGMFTAYGLVHDLLRAGVPVDWVIEPGKAQGGVDFTAASIDLQSNQSIASHGYRGGPFVIDASHAAAALVRIQAWQATNPQTTVHAATAPFLANAARELAAAPTVAVLADGYEDAAFNYLNAAKIPMSNGAAWPAGVDGSGAYACPGTYCCPDCFTPARMTGPAVDNPSDGALFDAHGAPRYCEAAAMGNHAPPGLNGVVAELRAFLERPGGFFAASDSVLAFENDANGGFLTVGGFDSQGPPPNVDYHASDEPVAQTDGAFQNGGGGDSSFRLLAGAVYRVPGAAKLTKLGVAEGGADILISGRLGGDPANGKVVYIGGRSYGTTLPMSAKPKSQGTRYFLNAIFDAPCTSSEGSPSVHVSLSGSNSSAASNYTYSVCVGNDGPGTAWAVTLNAPLPAGATFVAATGGGAASGDAVTWTVGALAAGESVCFDVTVGFVLPGSYSFGASAGFAVGMTPSSAAAQGSFGVTFNPIRLLRYGGVTGTVPLTPSAVQIFAGRGGLDPALDAVRDLEVSSFTSGAGFPHDASDLTAASPVLVYYQVAGVTGSTLRLAKSAGRVVITF